jgi:hypothetical protein
MKEVVGEFTQQTIGSTFFRGLKPINGVWAMSDITISNAVIMPVGFGIGDHPLFVIDMVTKDIIGKSPLKVVHPALQWLNTKLPGIATTYAAILEDKLLDNPEQAHRMHRRGT